MPPRNTPQILNVQQTAKILGVSVRIVQRRILNGDITATKLPGRTGAYVIDRAEVTRYQRDHPEERAAADTLIYCICGKSYATRQLALMRRHQADCPDAQRARTTTAAS